MMQEQNCHCRCHGESEDKTPTERLAERADVYRTAQSLMRDYEYDERPSSDDLLDLSFFLLGADSIMNGDDE